ncbi:hypothetical protein AAV94_13185 [Lampropedia cohaerens]|uniref:DUF4124 domain-containing protein n=1 Tax=Lampropedia cohaerens TaxID=1610491 RepID=A0A0U1PX23_9BURK|nr:DUF4124 domain-containing protein [Lampropedia cohaerens]KKW67006.1 hypothetical protein AAV94_13185 [Lampropedia cohaerens]
MHAVRLIPPMWPALPLLRAGRLVACALLVLPFISTPAAAQVHRCVQPDGSVLYTDGACIGAIEQVEIMPARSAEQIEADLLRDRAALERTQAQVRAWQEERRLRAELEAQAAKTARPSAVDYENSVECRQARRNVERLTVASGRYSSDDLERLRVAQDAAHRACLGPEAWAEIQRERAVQPPPPIVVRQPLRPPRWIHVPRPGIPVLETPHWPHKGPWQHRPRRPDRPPPPGAKTQQTP